MIPIIVILFVIIGSFLLVSFIFWISFISEMAPNSAIRLNMFDAIYAFRQGKIKKGNMFCEFYTNQTYPVKVKTSFLTFTILIILSWVDGSKKINKEATNEFLKSLYEKRRY